jgi:hypothetical protein
MLLHQLKRGLSVFCNTPPKVEISNTKEIYSTK